MPERTFQDSSGTEWLVYDCAPAEGLKRGFAPELQTGWLCFQCATEKRRLVKFPKEWDRYTPRQLEMLLKEATVVAWVSPATGSPRFADDPKAGTDDRKK